MSELLHNQSKVLTLRENGVMIFKKIPIDEINIIYDFLENTKIPLLKNKTGRTRTFGEHHSITLGYIKERVSRKVCLSRYTRLNMELYEELLKFGEKYVPIPFTSIHVNKNVVCPKHKDKNNINDSFIISFGDYNGGELNINQGDYIETFNTNLQGVLFNGSQLEHYNQPIISGVKYSLVFFSIPFQQQG